MSYDAFLFDIDGTLINTQIIDYPIQRDLLASFGYDLSPQVYASTFGMDRKLMVKTLLQHVTSGPTVEQYMEAYVPRLKAGLRESRELLVPGVDTWCQQLYLKGVPLAIVTSSPKDDLQDIVALERLLPLFSLIITSDDVDQAKPNPEPYKKAVGALSATNPFVFEDSLPGALSANRANLPFALHTHSANMEVSHITATMKHYEFAFADYLDPQLQRLIA